MVIDFNQNEDQDELILVAKLSFFENGSMVQLAIETLSSQYAGYGLRFSLTMIIWVRCLRLLEGCAFCEGYTISTYECNDDTTV